MNSIYCDFQKPENYITGMKIIHISTRDLRTIVQWDIPYSELYNHFEKAYESEEIHPQKWYDECVDIKNIFNNESELLIAAEDVYIYGSIPVDLPKVNKSELVDEHLDLMLLYAIGGAARTRTEMAGKIALGIKESQLCDEQVAAYRSVRYLLFHYWSNPVTYELTHIPKLVDRNEVPGDYLVRQDKDAVKFLLLDYNPHCPANLGECDILKTQRRGEIRYLPFVTTLDSIKL